MPDTPERSSLAVLRRLLPFLSPYRARLALAFVFLVIAAAATLVVPLAFRQLIDHGFSATVSAPVTLSPESSTASSALAAAGAQATDALNRAATSHVNLYFLGLFAVAVVLAASTAARFYMVSWLGERVVADLRTAVYTRMLDQSPEFFETTRSGEVLSRLTTDTTLIQTVVGTSMSMGLRNVFLFGGGMTMLAFTSLKLFAITLGLLALVIIPIVVMGRRVRKLSRASQDRIADSSALAGEILNAMPTVQAFTQEKNEATRFHRSVEASFATAIRRTTTRAWLTTLVITLVFGAIVFVLWLGANAVMAGTMSPGLLAAFVLYAMITAGAIGGLTETWGDVLRAAGATDRLMELLDAQTFIASPSNAQPFTVAAAIAAPRGGIAVRFDHVQFHYPSRPDTASLADFTLHIAAGETVALVGPSGAGKSTVFQLLMRFYAAQTGAITLGDRSIDTLSLDDLRQSLGIVPQDTVIFSADARENIRYGRPDATDAEIVAAAKAAQAHDFIERMPEGLFDLPRRARRAIVRRPAPAHRDRPRDPAQPAGAAARRGNQCTRRRERGRRAARARDRDGRPHDARHRASAGHDQEGRPHRRDGRGPHRRIGDARGADGARRAVRATRDDAVLDADRSRAATFRATGRCRLTWRHRG